MDKVSLHVHIWKSIALQLFFGPQSQQPELPVEPEEDFPLWKLENGTWKEPSCLPAIYEFDKILTLWCFPSFCFVLLWQSCGKELALYFLLRLRGISRWLNCSHSQWQNFFSKLQIFATSTFVRKNTQDRLDHMVLVKIWRLNTNL